jgi:uncharacterized membrane protein YoaK (UPF0700 family)
MNAVKYDASDRSRDPLRWWSVITFLFAVAVFGEVIFAGAMLSGSGWARAAHAVNARILIAAMIAAGLVAIVSLRRIPQARKLGWTLLSLAGLVFVQAALGALSAKGANLMWIHIPLGVALFSVAAFVAMANMRLRNNMLHGRNEAKSDG